MKYLASQEIKMELNEAKKILNDNGYELLEEGKLGRALGIGALALGGLVGNANAIDQNDIDRFEKQTEMEDQKYLKIDKNDYVENIDDTHIIYVNRFNYKAKDGSVRNELHATLSNEDRQNLNYHILLYQLPGHNNIDKSDFYNYVINKSSYIKSIRFGSNDDILSVTIYKNGEPIKTLCKDGSVYPGDVYYVNKYNIINKCNGLKGI